MQDKAFANPKIEFIWDSEIADITDLERGEVTGILVRNLKTGSLTDVALDGVFIAIGHTRTRRSSAGRSSSTKQATSARTNGTKTNCPGVFAAGDVQDHIYRQAVTAAGSGCYGRDRRRALPRRPADSRRDPPISPASLEAPAVNEMLKP